MAWVYDPHTDEEGCFGWVDGDVHRIPNFSIADNNGDGVERTPKEMESALPEEVEPKPGGARPPWIRWGTTALKYLSAMALGFAIAYFLFPRFYLVAINPLTGEPMLVQPQGPTRQPDANAGRNK